MKKFRRMGLLIFATTWMLSCGNGKKDSATTIKDMKAELEKLKTKRTETDLEIRTLQLKLEKLDSNSESSSKIKLVGLSVIGKAPFRHYIDLQGHVDAENISYISPRMGPAQVKAIFIKQGQMVKKGQLLMKLDDAIMRQQVMAATQQMQGIKTQLEYAKTIYERQKNLWDKGIGTEVQLINARTNMEGLENQLKSAGEQVKVAQEQLNTSNVYSDVDGTADVVNIKVGEIFTGVSQNGRPQIQIVNTQDLKVVTNIPENYISRLQKGTPVVLKVPDVGKTYISEISRISQSIDATQRGFIAEAKIPYDPILKPNQTIVVKILDYSVDNVVVIPVNVLQTDESGKYVFVYENEKDKVVAKKKSIVMGEIYGDSVEIKSGLQAGQQLITEGYQNLYEGQMIATQPK